MESLRDNLSQIRKPNEKRSTYFYRGIRQILEHVHIGMEDRLC